MYTQDRRRIMSQSSGTFKGRLVIESSQVIVPMKRNHGNKYLTTYKRCKKMACSE